jgi:hypothetical protein
VKSLLHLHLASYHLFFEKSVGAWDRPEIWMSMGELEPSLPLDETARTNRLKQVYSKKERGSDEQENTKSLGKTSRSYTTSNMKIERESFFAGTDLPKKVTRKPRWYHYMSFAC